MALKTVILAAGKGTRMRSSKPKVMHLIGGVPMLAHVHSSALAAGSDQVIIVYGHGGNTLIAELDGLAATWVEQAEQLGTGHAVSVALPELGDADTALVLYGDVPLITGSTLKTLIAQASANSIALLTVHLAEPRGYGRIIRDNSQKVQAIVEEKDASEQQKMITEVNTGILAAPVDKLRQWLSGLSNNNAQGEYYLTDIIAMAVSDGLAVNTVNPADTHEVLGVNDRSQQAQLERRYQLLQAEQLMAQGVTLRDPARFDLRGQVTSVGHDVQIDINVLLEGEVALGDGVSIGANCIVRNSRIGSNVEILPNSIIEDSIIGEACRIGPFARIRPDTELADHVHVGNFVEIKKSTVNSGSKINHLSYVGDSSVGSRVNIGAGTITCNYDGVNKFRTEIGDDAFIGSDTQLVAPVRVGAGATIGAGSTITKDAEAGQLTLSRGKQISVRGWKRPVKN